MAPRPWLTAAAIFASTLALLGTSDVDEPRRVYTFEKLGLDGPEATLTAAAPVARFLVTVQVDALGPDGVDSTQRPSIGVRGDVRASELAADADAPFVAVRIGAVDAAPSELRVLKSFDVSADLRFEGDCKAPGQGTPCVARTLVELARLDDGSAGGSVGVTWSFDLTSTADLPGEGNGVASDPPWSVEVAPQ